MRRLMSHPSFAIGVGNNEDEESLARQKNQPGLAIQPDKAPLAPPKPANYSQYYSDYVKLDIDTIRATMLATDPSRHFLPSSPTNGIGTEQEHWVADNPCNWTLGE